MKIVVHIGPPKTGSTSIQKSLSANRDSLLEQGVYYYDRDKMLPRALTTLYMDTVRGPHPRLVKHFGSAEAVLAWSESCWEEFEQDVDRLKPELSVISSEFFPTISDIGPMMERLRKRFDEIWVLAYARDPVDLYVSTLQQNIRGGERLVELDTPRSFKFAMRRHLEKFGKAVGFDRMIVRNFSRSNLVGGDVVADFASVLSSIGPDCEIEPVKANESVPAAAVAWLLASNSIAFNTGSDRKGSKREVKMAVKSGYVNKRLTEQGAFSGLAKLKMTDQAMAETIRRKAHDDCVWINETFLQGQEPLAVADRQRDPAGPVEERDFEQVRDWVLGHVGDPGMVAVLKALIDTSPTKPVRKVRKKKKRS